MRAPAIFSFPVMFIAGVGCSHFQPTHVEPSVMEFERQEDKTAPLEPPLPAAEYYHVWKLDAAYDKPIPDPEQWAADNFSDAPNAAKDDWKIERFELDLNHDGVPEVFLTTPQLHGTGGGPHLVFQKRGEFYFYGGQISGRRHTIRVLPVEADGSPRIMTFWNGGGGGGTASVWKWDGKAFQAISSEVIWSSDSGTEEGRRRFKELFGKKGIEPSGAANGSQPLSPDSKSTPPAAGFRR